MTASTHAYSAVVIDDGFELRLPVNGGTLTLDSGRSPHVTADIRCGAFGYWRTLPPPPLVPAEDLAPADELVLPISEPVWGAAAMNASFPTAAHLNAAFATAAEANAWADGLEVGPAGWVPGVDKQHGRDILAALDPRQSPPPRVRVDVHAVFPAHQQTRSFDLTVRGRTYDQDTGETRVQLASDEALLEDYRALADNTAPAAFAGSIRDVVEYTLGTALPATTLTAGDDQPAVGDDAAEDALTWFAGQSAMEFLHPLVQRCGLRLVCDESRNWSLRDEHHVAQGSLQVRYAVNMTAAEDTISRDDETWFDGAVTVYVWTDADGVEHREVDAYSLTPAPTRVVRFERDRPFPGPGFSEYAVRRAQGRGHSLSAAKVADWSARAEQSVTVVLAEAIAFTQTGVTQSVTFDLDRDEITVVSRTVDTPEHAWVLIEDGEAWTDSPVGESWVEEVV